MVCASFHCRHYPCLVELHPVCRVILEAVFCWGEPARACSGWAKFQPFFLTPGTFHLFTSSHFLSFFYASFSVLSNPCCSSTLAIPQLLLLLSSCFSSCRSSVFSILFKNKNRKPINKIPSCFLSHADDAPYFVPFPHGGSAGLVLELGLGAVLSCCHRSLCAIH